MPKAYLLLNGARSARRILHHPIRAPLSLSPFGGCLLLLKIFQPLHGQTHQRDGFRMVKILGEGEIDRDINAGRVLEGATIEEVGREIFETIVAVAGGAQTKSEQQGFGDEEFCPWSIGPVL